MLKNSAENFWNAVSFGTLSASASSSSYPHPFQRTNLNGVTFGVKTRSNWLKIRDNRASVVDHVC